MSFYYYVSNGLFSLVILLILYMNSVMRKGKTRCDVLMRLIMVVGILLAVFDTVSWMLSGQDIPYSVLLQNVANGSCDFCIALISVFWLMFVHEKLISSLKHRKRRQIIFQIPAYISALLIPTNPFHHWIFYIDENLEYVRGPLYLIFLGLPFGYITFASVLALYQYRKEVFDSRKTECLLLASFPIIPLASAIIQASSYGLSLCVPGLTLAILLIYLNQQNLSLTLDPLTKLNNRGQLDYYLNKRFSSFFKDNQVYFLLMDVDNFKNINDTHGHVEGDEALMLVASALKQAFKQTDAFLARYGGDEFAALVEDVNSDDINTIVQNINMTLEEKTKVTNKPYKLTVSAGFSSYDVNCIHSVNELIATADKEMFKVKKSKKKLTV